MSAVCSICRREDRTAIEKAHIDGLSLRVIAKQFVGVSAWSLRRHFQHVPMIIEQQKKIAVRLEDGNRATAKLPARVEALVAELEKMTANAVRRKDYASALRAIGGRLQALKMIGELSGELRPGGAGEFVPGTTGHAAAAASVTVNLPTAAPKDRARFVELLREIYGLDADHVKNRTTEAKPGSVM